MRAIKTSTKNHNTIDYEFKNKVIGSIPENLSYLIPNIEKSKYMLDLNDNWDDEGSKKFEEITWLSAIKFLLDYAKTIFKERKIEIKSPKIYHGPKGSIDIMWEVEKFRMVVNVNKNGEDAMFYADNYKDQFTEGSFKIKQFSPNLLLIAIHL